MFKKANKKGSCSKTQENKNKKETFFITKKRQRGRKNKRNL